MATNKFDGNLSGSFLVAKGVCLESQSSLDGYNVFSIDGFSVITAAHQLQEEGFFTGYLFDEQYGFIRCFEEGFLESAIKGCVGEYAGISARGGDCVFYNDVFGMASLYYCSTVKAQFVTNDLYLAMKVFGGEPDRAVFNSLFFSKSSVFTNQPLTHRTIIRDVFKVPVTHSVRFCSGRIILEEKKQFLDLHLKRSTVERKELFKKGVAEILRNAQSVLDKKDVNEVVVKLSGGKDSRVLLSTLLPEKKEVNKDKIVVFTDKVKSSNDHLIASSIAHLYGLKLPIDSGFYSGEGKYKRITPSEHINYFLKYNFGSNFRLSPRSRSLFGDSPGVVSLYGGGGELYREYYGEKKQFKESLKKCDGSVESFSSNVFNEFLSEDLLPATAKNMKEDVLGLVSEEFKKISSDTLYDAVELLYLFFRNPSHFGNKSLKRFHDGFACTTLLSVDLFKSVYGLPPDKKKVVFEGVVFELNSVLSKIEYDSDLEPKVRLTPNEEVVNKALYRPKIQIEKGSGDIFFEALQSISSEAERDRIFYWLSLWGVEQVYEICVGYLEKREKRGLVIAAQLLCLSKFQVPEFN